MWAILGAIFPVFFAVAGGAVLRRMGWLRTEADDSLLRLGINLLYPCLILGSLIDSEALRNTEALVVAPLLAFGLVWLGILLARGLGRAIGLNDEDSRSFAFAAGMFNYGFIATPLALSIFGENTIGMLFVFNLGVEVALWSVGIRTLTGGRAQRGAWKKMISPPVVAIVVGVLLNQLGGGQWMPQPVMAAFDFLGAASIPIALIITGALLADNTSWETLRNGIKTAVAAVGLRNVALPLLFLLLAGWFTQPVELQNVLITQSAMPSAMAPLMLARYYHVNPIPALLVIVSTTLMCVVTTPIWITVGRWWWQ